MHLVSSSVELKCRTIAILTKYIEYHLIVYIYRPYSYKYTNNKQWILVDISLMEQDMELMKL